MRKLSRTQAIVASITLGGVAVLLLQTSAHAGTRSIFVLGRTVQAGATISQSDLTAVSGAPAGVARDAITTLTGAVGHTARVDLLAGQVLVSGDLGTPVRQGLRPGEEGITIPADLVSSGGALPGDYVNVRVVPGQTSSGIVTSMQPAATGSTVPILTHVRVVNVYNASGQPITGYSAGSTLSASTVPAAVELAVQPAQANMLDGYEGAQLLLTIAPWATSSSTTQQVSTQPLLPPTTSTSRTSPAPSPRP